MEIALQQSSHPDPDRELARRFRGGDRQAFDRIVREHRTVVYRMARRLLSSHEDADEAAQEAFLRAWNARERFRGDATLRTWLVRIVLNVARSMLGRPRTRVGERAMEPPAESAVPPDEALARMQSRHRVRRAVDALPPRQREVVRLKVFSELTHREVAALLDLTEGAVKAHLHQAIGNLRRSMTGAGEE